MVGHFEAPTFVPGAEVQLTAQYGAERLHRAGSVDLEGRVVLRRRDPEQLQPFRVGMDFQRRRPRAA